MVKNLTALAKYTNKMNKKMTEEKNWLDFRDREKDENGIIQLTDEELTDIPLTTIRCWKFNKFGSDSYTNEKGESDFCCPNCPCSEQCHNCTQTPLEKRYNQLKGIRTEKQSTLLQM